MKKLRGVFPVPVTAFTKIKQAVDYGRLADHVEWLVSSGVHGLVSNGSTCEFPLLSEKEAKKVGETIIKAAAGRVPVIFGASAPSSWKTMEYCKMAEDIGAACILALPAYYFPLGEAEIIKHYEIVSKATALPIMVYNNPGVSKIDIKPPTVAKLAEIEHIDYIKESSGQAARVHEIKALAGDKIDVFIGSDNILFDALVSGATGSIASSGNLIPAEMSQIFNLIHDKKDIAGARKLFDKVSPLCSFVDGSHQFVQVIKTALEIMGKPVGPPRYPLLPIAGPERKALTEVLKKLGMC